MSIIPPRRFKQLRFDTKERQQNKAKRQKEIDVTNWWREKVHTRVLFREPKAYDEGDDYIGTLPWPRYVSLRALHHEYNSENLSELTRLQFAYQWHRASGIPRATKTKMVERYYVRSMYDLSKYLPNLHVVDSFGVKY